MDLSVIIPTHRRAEKLAACVASLAGQELDGTTIWVTPPEGYRDKETSLEWRPVKEGDLRDIRVIFRPDEFWSLEDVIAPHAGGETAAGGNRGPVHTTSRAVPR